MSPLGSRLWRHRAASRISANVHEAMGGKINLAVEDLGECHLKNIARPVRAYILRDAAEGKPQAAPLSLPDKPSIAVLAFENLSGEPQQDYFADGIVEEIITALSRIKWLFVIARNSSFAYRGRAIDVKQVGRELGVRYVLEGSVRKSGNRVRINGQLIDAASGMQIWADRFEGALEDIFDLQDQVTMRVVGAISPKLEEAEIERARRKPTDNLDAYQSYMRGMSAFYGLTEEGNREALVHFYRAIEIDPNFASAFGMAARTYAQRKAFGWPQTRIEETSEVERLARRAALLGKDDAVALTMAGIALGYSVGDLDSGDSLISRAVALNPNLASAWLFSGWIKSLSWRKCVGAGSSRARRTFEPTGSQPVQYADSHSGRAFHCGKLPIRRCRRRPSPWTISRTTFWRTAFLPLAPLIAGKSRLLATLSRDCCNSSRNCASRRSPTSFRRDVPRTSHGLPTACAKRLASD